MKFCPRCGLQLDNDVNFCPVCGLKQPERIPPASSNAASAAYPAPGYSPAPGYVPMPGYAPPAPGYVPAPGYAPTPGYAPPMPGNAPAPVYAHPMPNYAPAPVYVPPSASYAPAHAVKRRPRGAVGYLVWSLLLTVLCSPVGTPLGIIGAILTAVAGAETTKPERARKFIRAAKVLCIVATVLDVLLLAALIVWAVRSPTFSFDINQYMPRNNA